MTACPGCDVSIQYSTLHAPSQQETGEAGVNRVRLAAVNMRLRQGGNRPQPAFSTSLTGAVVKCKQTQQTGPSLPTCAQHPPLGE